MKTPTEVAYLSLRRSQMLAAQADHEFIRSPFFLAPAIGQR
jgi:hypothetical protein